MRSRRLAVALLVPLAFMLPLYATTSEGEWVADMLLLSGCFQLPFAVAAIFPRALWIITALLLLLSVALAPIMSAFAVVPLGATIVTALWLRRLNRPSLPEAKALAPQR